MPTQTAEVRFSSRSIRTETVARVLAWKGSAAWSLSPNATVYEAVAMMDEKHVGALLVTSGGALVGIISERDYARKVILKGKSSKETLVREIMSSPVITVGPGHRVEECMRIMTERRIRHLPVMEGTRLAGVVSIGDLVRSIISAQADVVEHLSNYISCSYPA